MSGRRDLRRQAALACANRLVAWTLCCAAALGCLGAFATGCNLNQEGVRPPANRIFFPGGAVIQASGPGAGKWLYVVNSNSDLRYNAGTVVAVDLQRVRRDYPFDPERLQADGTPKQWSRCPTDTRRVPPANIGPDDRCCWEYLDSNVLACDEQVYVNKASTVRIGNFGGRPVMQKLAPKVGCEPDCGRLFVPVRGDASIGMVEVVATAEGVRFSCTGDRTVPVDTHGQFPVCEPDWLISRAHPFTKVPLPESDIQRLPSEPYALAVDDALELLYVGHLRGGAVSLIDLGTGQMQRTPELLQVASNLLPSDPNGSQGVTGLTIKTPGCFGAIYVTSRYSPVVGSFVVYGINNQCGEAREPTTEVIRGVSIVGTGQYMSTGLSGSETRGIEFVRQAAGQEPDRAFILQRTPPALVAIDNTSNAPFATIEVCQSPTNLVQQTDAAGRAVALFVTCFEAGEVYVIDPWVPRLRSVIPVGRGPVATVVPPPGAAAEYSTRAYVVGFGANNISVIDLDPSSPTQYRVIQRIGFSSPTPREVGPQ